MSLRFFAAQLAGKALEWFLRSVIHRGTRGNCPAPLPGCFVPLPNAAAGDLRNRNQWKNQHLQSHYSSAAQSRHDRSQ